MPRTPIQTSSGLKLMLSNKYCNPFGCPLYALKGQLQTGSNIFHNWKERRKVEMYLGRSPLYARNMFLVLSHNKVHASHQVCVYFGTLLHTVTKYGFDCLLAVKDKFMIQIVQIGKNKSLGE